MKTKYSIYDYITDIHNYKNTNYTDEKNSYITISCHKCVELKYICEYCLSLEEHYDELPF